MNTVSSMDAVGFSEKDCKHCGHTEETIYFSPKIVRITLLIFVFLAASETELNDIKTINAKWFDLCNAHYAFIMNMPLFTISNL